MSVCIPWSEEEKAFVFQNYKKAVKPVILEELNKRFGNNRTISSLKVFYERNHLRNGINVRFKKGQPSANKGKKMSAEVRAKVAASGTWYKKGSMPHNYLPVGSEVHKLNRNTWYWYVKVADPNKWRLKQAVMYEKYHNVKLKPNERIIFLDGNTSNFDITNLRLVTTGELCYKNRWLPATKNPEENNIYIDLTKIKIKVGKIES